MRRQRAKSTAIRRLFVLAGALVVVLVVGYGWAAAATTTTTATAAPATTTTTLGGAATTTTSATGGTTTTSEPPMFTENPSVESKYARNLQPVDLTAARQGYVTRGQLAVRLAELLGLQPSTVSYYSDVVGQEECFGAVGALHEAKLLTGVNASGFSPDELVSRAQALVWITDALAYRLSRDDTSQVPFRFSYFDSAEEWLGGFKDRALVADALARGVANAYRLGVVDVPADGYLYPALPLSQTDMTSLLDGAFAGALTVRTEAPKAVPARASYEALKVKSTGPLVWYLEYQLATLKYRLGPVDGIFDIRTRDAVLAFQKVEKLKRDGVVGDALWQRLATAQTPVPKRSEAGTRVEIDLTRQVLFMITDDQVTEIVHVSSGAPQTATLVGSFEIEKKMEGWVTSSYRTGMYFMSFFDVDHRLGIHGYAQVPVWPASHGCVRVPVWVAKEISDQLPMGTHVYIYK